MNGKLILFEGGDGSGKTSQLQAVRQWLPSITATPIVTTQEPYDPAVRTMLNNDLSPLAELLLFMSDRANHFDKVVLPALNRGDIVLCDRGYPSTYAYQVHGRNLNVSTVRLLNKLATDHADPDLVLWLDIPPIIGLSRSGRGDRIEQEDMAFHERVWNGYRIYAATQKNVVRFDATESFSNVTDRVKFTIEQHLYQWAKDSNV